MPQHEVFISYAHADRSAAETICRALEGDGLRCWIAPRDVVPGIPYADAIVDAIERSRLVVLVFSAAANTSEAVLNELELATNRQRPVLPVRLADVPPAQGAEYYLRRRHWFDAYPQLDERLADLVRSAQQALAPEARAATASGVPQPAAGNLPLAASSFIGRDREISDITNAVGSQRIITLWGMGGVGKTRLALEVAQRVAGGYPDGAWFVDLAATAADDAAVGATVTSALRIAQRPGEPYASTIADALSRRRALVVLDNCEHVVAACATLVRAIGECAAGVCVIATSREPLGIDGERIVRIDPFDVADDAASPAVCLFFDRARAAGAHDLDGPAAARSVATICRRLDGIPFAIELAAARARVMSPERIAGALDARFRLLTGGTRTALPRQQTLRGMLDWSYDLLGERERTVFRRGAVFAGSFDLEALQAVVADEALDAWEALDALHGLVDKSLVVAEPVRDDRRYRMLETAREYAAQRLTEAGETEAIAAHHAVYYAELARATHARYWGDYASDAFEALAPERDNLRVALTWALRDGGNPALAAGLSGNLAIFWNQQGQAVAGLRSAEEVVAHLNDSVPAGDGANAWTGLAFLAGRLMMHDRAIETAQRAAALAREAELPVLEARALSIHAMALVHLERHEDAVALHERIRALADATGDARSAVSGLERSAFIAAGRERWSEAEALLGDVLVIQRAHGAGHEAGVTLYNQAEMAYIAGDSTRAIALAREAVELCGSTEAHRLQVLLNLSGYLLDVGRIGDAAATLREALDICRRNRYPIWGAFGVQYAAEVAARTAEPDAAERLLHASNGMLVAAGGHRGPGEQRSYDRLAAALGSIPASVDEGRFGDPDAAYDAANAEARRVVALVCGSVAPGRLA